MNKIIITAAIQGAELSKCDTPFLPITIEEVALEAKRAYEAGASVIHLHVRDSLGRSTQKTEVYHDHLRAIKEIGCKAIIQVSTGGAVGMSAEEREGPIYLKPEYATLNTGSINFGNDLFLNPVCIIEKLASVMLELGVKPEFEIYEEGHIHNAIALCEKGLVKGKLNFNFVMGVPGAIGASIKNLLFLSEAIPRHANWTVAGIGKNELVLGGAAIFMGGNVRVGLEDNIYLSKGVLAKSNGELVERIVEIAERAGRKIASPDEARDIIGIEKL